jgi:hypothetical protein
MTNLKLIDSDTLIKKLFPFLNDIENEGKNSINQNDLSSIDSLKKGILESCSQFFFIIMVYGLFSVLAIFLFYLSKSIKKANWLY